jgi:hypothetical protein
LITRTVTNIRTAYNFKNTRELHHGMREVLLSKKTNSKEQNLWEADNSFPALHTA